MATKSQELATLKSTLENKQTSLGETSKTLADSEEEKAATQKQLDDDEAFFETTKDACKSKADAWAERSRLRTEELAGINKAVEILTSDEASATFGRATSMFLQTSADAEAPKNKAYTALKAVARKYHSLRLAALAATVKTTATGHFNAVIKTVEKMIGELRSEEQDDVDHRDWCQEQENQMTNQKEDLNYKVGQTSALIERLTSKSDNLGTAIASTEAEILATQETMAEAMATRNEENADFKAALKDDTDAVALLASALEALNAYAKNNKLGLVQKKAPEYAVDPDKAPAADFADGGSHSSESGGITSIIGMIKEDLENEIKEGKSAEANAQAEFNTQRAESLKTLGALKEKKTNQEMQKADTDQKTEDAEGVKSDTETQSVEKQMEMDAIEPNCSWIKGAFAERRTKRKAEIDGLYVAKQTLAGTKGSEEFLQEASTKSFLQKRMA